jgi:hypothetical protein
VFRHHVGAALIRREDLPEALLRYWLSRRAPHGRELADQEASIGLEVSRHIGDMPVLLLDVPDRADRGYLESNSIALLSCQSHRRAGHAEPTLAGPLRRMSRDPRIGSVERSTRH